MPECFRGFVHTIVLRQTASYIKERIKTRNTGVSVERLSELHAPACPPPDESVNRIERASIVRRALSLLPPRHREILIRFYVWEQRAETIMAEMKLSDTQFRLLKSRAKARFGKEGRNCLRVGTLKRLVAASGS
jgi:DNA-directed RNA polymerase specialized sigma24 family protein